MVKERKALVLSIFCDYKSTVEQTVENVLRSLLKQLVQDYGLFPLTKTLHANRKTKHPSLDDLTKCLSEVLGCVSSHVYIVLDALDEFANDHREHLIDVIQRMLGDNIYLLVMSRPDIALDLLFEADTTFNIEASTDDIGLYIEDRLSQSWRLASIIKGKGGLIARKKILSQVIEKSYNMCVTHTGILVAPINQLSIGSFWQGCIWTHLLAQQELRKHLKMHLLNCQTI